MAKYLNASLVIIGFCLLLVVTYWWAVFSTSFNINMCYSGVISFVSQEAQAVATSKDENRTAVFKSMLQGLPLHGYETDCNEVDEAIAKYKNAHAQK